MTTNDTYTSHEIIGLAKKYLIGNYTRYPVCLVRGEGSWVWDAEGNRYLDFFPGWGCRARSRTLWASARRWRR